MKDKKAIITFNNRTFSVYAEGKLLFRDSASIVYQKDNSSPLFWGEEADILQDGVQEETFYSRPFESGTIRDKIGAKLYLRTVLKKLFPRNKPEILLPLSSALSPSQRKETEETFSESGYTLRWIAKPVLLSRLSQKSDCPLVVEQDEKNTDVAICNGGTVQKSYATDIGSLDGWKKVKETVRERFGLTAGKEEKERGVRTFFMRDDDKPLSQYFSLYPSDKTPVEVVGWKENKTQFVCLPAKEFYASVIYPFEKACALLVALMSECDQKTTEEVIQKGILWMGEDIGGLDDFVYDKTKLHIRRSNQDDFLRDMTKII